ncbi:MAG: hypothetical protein K0U60_03540 [Actinomycetia bacterium]|nr:hypothetical protein [Actinomycetes bacterium]
MTYRRAAGVIGAAAGLALVMTVSTVGCSTSASDTAIQSDAPEALAPAPSATASALPSISANEGPTASPTTPAPVKSPRLPKLNDRNAIVYAPLDKPSKVTKVGRVSDTRAWSTSKVLVVLAYIKTVGRDNPANLSTADKNLIKQALQASDMNALLTLRGRIPGGSGEPMTEILRDIGDKSTEPWPDSREGSHRWSPQEQVRFMAALRNKEVVSPEASRFVRKEMKPIPDHRWGLGTVGAKTFKGGWLTADTDTRQMGLLRGYAVAIITDGVGPAELQTDGDSAHVRQMNRLARILNRYLDAEAAKSN